ncbi:UPF0182 family membrane protein [Actinomarinicola tropica]|uniref:UPF0182 protein GH723_02050 n=1 Tax=Actinomarinicola tropica TaxID=2789776 RepID=A0A5Q2RI08_9ACTN|nr:UPF0182 family protein [Actinomarinicola tropica]QGG93986.1 hypothetical protein GH723_02050 [Actinomarinicola tropica]
MRPPTQMPRPPRRSSNRGRIILVVVLVAAFLLVTSLRGIAGVYTDYLWFDALELGEVWTGVVGAQIILATIFVSLFFVLMFANLWVADRLAPRFRPTGPEEELLERYHDVVGPRANLVRAGISLVFALIAGAGTASQWNSWILFRNRVDFGVDDPQFGMDVGFYVFQLPFLSFLTSWLFAAFIIILIVTAAAHYVNGGIRVQISGERVTPQVKAHLSVLLGILALVRAAGYWLDRYELNFSTRGHVDGAGYTDVNAQLPAIQLLLLISLFAAALFLYNIRRRGWVLPVVAVGLWAFVSIVMAGIYPAFIQRFQVDPAESTREAPYIERNMEATRQAMGIDDVEVRDFAYQPTLDAEDIQNNQDIIRNIRLLDPTIVNDTFQRLQADFGFYRFNDLDVDRYMIDGELTQVVVGARELNPDGIPIDSWEGQTLAYTHGYGPVVAPSNAIDASGRPSFVVGEVPIEGDANIGREITQPQIYFGEQLSGYSIVNTDRREIDYEVNTPEGEDEEAAVVEYTGDNGVQVGSWLRRAAFALRFADYNPLISDYIRSDSQILYIRDVRERLETVAPFIHFDADPYAVVIDGGVSFVVDGYTTTDRYPYAQRADREQLQPGSGLDHDFNYVRNSVKAVVNGYDGEVTLYVVDDEDPLVRAYRQAFPGLFADMDEMPDGLEDNLRYPEDLFTIQTNMFGRYHLTEVAEFYSQSQAWDVAQDPGIRVGEGDTSNITTETGEVTGRTREDRIEPYYLLMRLPEEEEQSFVMLRSFVPISQNDQRKELRAFMVAESDPDDYGRLVTYVTPGTDVDGPGIVNANIVANEVIAPQISLLNREGSEVLLGDLILVPIEDSILYVRPLYTQASGQTQVPELRHVIVASGERIVMEDSLQEALEELFPGSSPETLEDPEFVEGEETEGEGEEPAEGEGEEGEGEGETGGETDPEVEATVESLLTEANDLLEEADAALRDGSLAEYERLVNEARDRIAEAIAIRDGEGEDDAGGGGATTTTSAPPPDST